MITLLRNLKISQKIPLAIIIFIVIPVLMLLMALRSAGSINEGGQEIYDNYFVSVVNLTDARKHTYEEFVWLKSHIISPDDNAMREAERRITNAAQQLTISLDEFSKTLDPGEETELFQQVQDEVREMAKLRDQIVRLSQTNNDVEADRLANNEYRALFEQLHKQLEDMFQTNVVGAEAFYQSNQETYDASWQFIVSAILVVLVIGVGLGWGLVASIQQPLREATKQITDIDKNNDLTQSLPIVGQDEIAQMNTAFNSMVASLRTVIRDIAGSLKVLSSESDALAKVVDDSNCSLSTSSEVLAGVSHSTAEITSATQEIAQSADNARQEAQNSDKEAQQGLALQNQAINAVEGLKVNMTDTSAAIEQLSNDTNEIGSVLDVIRGIADQTNLLALNAAIEAARAGEQGRGFAVVADEVRTLAQRTQESTSEIQHMIEKLQAGAQLSVNAMQGSMDSLDKTVDLSQSSEQAITNIVDMLSNILSMNDQIASATEEQSVTLQSITEQVDEANQLSQRSNEALGMLQTSSNELRNIISVYEPLLAKFKIT
ncbi:methyl-accepting chemotaxis protein [Thalassotalea euphylliae]|uniref:Methyl-accepting chemotaxis protein n=1 Tax=Thalassotalea euphylliae TaxID=1655234 RepID=A0A3E0UH48_9GAMM|nr:methyl-accepting chemotaxis protein [Thalassotalea euphylliae]REL36190.1 methyl-accepting chemotaxis protein [Thalassotalea euphylliae]